MLIVCVAPYVPAALIGHAGGAYLFRYLQTLAREHEIVLLAPETRDNAGFLTEAPEGVRVHLVPCRQPSGRRLERRWWNLRNAPRGLTPGWQVLEGFRRDGEARGLLARADVVEIQWTQMLALLDVLPELRRPPVVAVAHDIVTQSFRRRVATASSGERPVLRWLSWRVRSQERRLINACARLRVLNDKDADLARSVGVSTPIDVVPPFLVLDSDPPAVGRQGVVACIGALWRPENADGLLWFCREVWPHVRRRRADAQLVLTGAGPGPELLALDGRDGVSVEGFRDDLRPAFARAGVFVAPLRQGAGIKIKVLEAMLARLPVVTTSVGAEGIAERAPSNALIVSDDPDVMATQIVDLLGSAERRATVATTACEWVSAEFSPSAVEEKALALYRDGPGRLRAQRRSR